MRALTLHRPWAWTVAAGFKTVENRPWPPPAFIIGQPIAIHAGKAWDPAGAEAIRHLLGPGALERAWAQDVRGAVVAIATVNCVVHSRQGDVFAIDHPDALDRQARRWFSGPYGWLLIDVVRLPNPVYCRGFQRLWTLPVVVAKLVEEQVELARMAREEVA